MLPLVGTTGLGFQVQHAPFYTNLTFAYNTETSGSLYSHALLILTGSSKSKNQAVHEQMFSEFFCAQSNLRWFESHLIYNYLFCLA